MGGAGRRAVFWDFDGTLTYGEPTWRQCMVLALGDAAPKYGVTEEKLRPYWKKGRWDIIGEAYWDDMFPRFEECYKALGVPPDLADSAAHQVRQVVQDERLYRVRREVPGVLMACAYKGYKNYVLTNNFPEWEDLFVRLKLRPYFAGVVNSGAVGLAKPDPRIFRRAEAVANFPATLWMVGDNPAADIQGAKNAGWNAIYLAKPGSPHCGADFTVQSLDEIPKLL